MDDWFISSVSFASLIRETGRQAKASRHSPIYKLAHKHTFQRSSYLYDTSCMHA